VNPKQFPSNRRAPEATVYHQAGRIHVAAALASLGVLFATSFVPTARAAWSAPTITSTDPAYLTTSSLSNAPGGYLTLRIRGANLLTYDFYSTTKYFVNGVQYAIQGGSEFYTNHNQTALGFVNSSAATRALFASPGTLNLRIETIYANWNAEHTLITSYSEFSSAEFQVPIRLPGDPLPAAPSDLRTSVYSHLPTKVRLDWKDNTTNETGFEIERIITVGDTTTHAAAPGTKAATNEVFHSYASVGKGITSFIDKKAYPGSKVEYRVRAKVGATNSDASPVATAITPPPRACRRPSFDLWSGGLRFKDPKGTNSYILAS
jgi:hypothetical protein